MRASLAAAKPTRALTSSDFTAGTETPSALATSVVAHPAQLAHEQGRALLLGQTTDVGDEPAQGVALLGSRRRVLLVGHRRVGRIDRNRLVVAQDVDAAVVGDPIQPRPQGEVAVVGAQSVVGAYEDLLKGVLGILT